MNEIFKNIKNETNKLFNVTMDLIYDIHRKNDLKKISFSDTIIPSGSFVNVSFSSTEYNYVFKFEIVDIIIDDGNSIMVDVSICNENGLEILKFISYDPIESDVIKLKELIEIY
jgi:hypothetical protein